MRTAGCIAAIALMAALVGCSHEKTMQSAHSGQGETRAYYQTSARTASSGPGSCPMAQLRDVQAFVSDMNEGVAITFTAPYAEVDQLRQNVRSMADANEMMGDAFASCPCAQGMGGGGGGVTESMPGDINNGSGTYGTPGSTANPKTGQMGQGLPNGSYGASQYGGAGPMDQSAIAMPPSKVVVDEIPSGAVLEFTAKDPSQLFTLRTAAKEHVHALRSSCLGGQPGTR